MTTCVSLTFEEAAEVHEPERKLYCHLLVSDLSMFIGKMLFLLLGLMVVEPVEPRSNPQAHRGVVQLLGSRSFCFKEISKKSSTWIQDEPEKDLPYIEIAGSWTERVWLLQMRQVSLMTLTIVSTFWQIQLDTPFTIMMFIQIVIHPGLTLLLAV